MPFDHEDDDPRGHLASGIAQACYDGDHQAAKKLHRELEAHDARLEEADAADDPDPYDPEELDDESQAGRGRPEKGRGETNTAGSGKGRENMESRQRRPSKAAVRSFSRRLLSD